MTEWSSAQMARMAGLIRERTGLTFPSARVNEVESAITRAMDRRGIDRVDRLAELLEGDDRVRESLVAELTIGESYFQRDPAQFELLRWQILPHMLRHRPDDSPIRVWSAGCASGEEPYTVAMVFDELDVLHRADIVGTDIARSRLEQAQRGLYTKWSLRNSPESVRTRYFAERGRYFELTPRLRRRVDFRYLNLAEDLFPSLSNGIWGMDVIMCRNVLIYFDSHTVERVARRLIASLSEDGWLLPGASDPALSELVDCDVVLTDAGLAYRRPGAATAADVRRGMPPATADVADVVKATYDMDAAGATDAAAATSAPTEASERDRIVITTSPVPASDDNDDAERGVAGSPGMTTSSDDDAIAAAYRLRDFDAVRAHAAAAAEAGTIDEAGWAAWLRSLANQGCLEDAAAVAARALARHPSSPELLYLHAVVLLQAGQTATAAVVVRHALYVDRQLIVAHLTLSEASRRSGRNDDARRALRNAAALLDRLPPDAVVPASDGERAGRLAELVRVKLRLLEEAAA
jgi:chemotaxis protein methyltransferase CheR